MGISAAPCRPTDELYSFTRGAAKAAQHLSTQATQLGWSARPVQQPLTHVARFHEMPELVDIKRLVRHFVEPAALMLR